MKQPVFPIPGSTPFKYYHSAEVLNLFVIKIGGSEGIDYSSFIEDLVQYEDWILVHGGSAELNRISEELGHPPRFVESVSGYTSRYTDRETLEMINMVYPGKMNKMIVEKLQQKGVNAVGLSALDGRILECKRKSTLKIKKGEKKMVLRGEHSGIIKNVNTELLDLLITGGYSPVLTIPAVSFEGTAVNVDGDRAAAEIAQAMGADELIILSNVPGLLEDVDDPDSVVGHINEDEIDYYLEEHAEGRMKKKLLGIKEALAAGVGSVTLSGATTTSPLTQALEGRGTTIE